jgi:hypothetical protein
VPDWRKTLPRNSRGDDGSPHTQSTPDALLPWTQMDCTAASHDGPAAG